MANPYQLDQESYADAIMKYQRAVKKQNTAVAHFNDSFWKDANGNQAGVVNNQWTTNSPTDRTGLGLWTAPDGSKFLRKPDKVNNLGMYHVVWPGDGDPTMRMMGPWAVPVDLNAGLRAMPVKALLNQGYVTGPSSNGSFSVGTAEYAPQPGEFTKKQPVKPEATVSQQAGPTASDVISAQQRGLISDVLASKGVR